MVLIHITDDRFIVMALQFMGFPYEEPIVRSKQIMERFLGCFGTTPAAAAAIWMDLQTITNDKARIEGINFKYFLMTLHWLKCYQIEHVVAGTFKVCEDTVRKWTWSYTMPMQALKEIKIRWDVLEGSPHTELISDDGVHFRVGHPRYIGSVRP